MAKQTTTLETIRIQVVAFVALAGCALALGMGHPAPEAAPRDTAVVTIASAGSFCSLEGPSRCQ